LAGAQRCGRPLDSKWGRPDRQREQSTGVGTLSQLPRRTTAGLRSVAWSSVVPREATESKGVDEEKLSACCWYTWPFGLPSPARHEHELARARLARARCGPMQFVLVPCRHYVPSSRHSTGTRPFFRVVPARGTATSTTCRLGRASPRPGTTIAPHSRANFTRMSIT
jgi:hypothetical protein